MQKYKVAGYIRLSKEDKTKDESNRVTNQKLIINKKEVIKMSNEEKSFSNSHINWLILFYSTPLTNPYKIRKN